MRPVEFGVNVHAVGSWAEFEALVRRADELGYDVFAAPDHLGALAPFTALAAAAGLSRRLRLRTYVLNVGFWNPALLAREVTTIDMLSEGRVELGLGAGHMKHEHDDAGLPWMPLDRRWDRVEEVLQDVRGRLQSRVPVMVGAMSPRGLEVAARHADIVGFAGLRQIKGQPLGTFTLATSAETAARVELVRQKVDGRSYRSDVLLQSVVLDRDPAEVAAEIAAAAPELSVAQILDCPFVLFAADARQAARELRRRCELYGFDSVTTHHPNLEPLGQVIAAYRA